mmetsp:Transcript_129980/g.243099  ORF Transcript_129980/g.243099 Transcript_129980/m.243099 type:complete len:700 (+) Transcript_129980:86-2185(+)
MAARTVAAMVEAAPLLRQAARRGRLASSQLALALRMQRTPAMASALGSVRGGCTDLLDMYVTPIMAPTLHMPHGGATAGREGQDKACRKKARWRVWAELEKHDEEQKLRMAMLLQELSELAKAANNGASEKCQAESKRPPQPGELPAAASLELYSSWNDPEAFHQDLRLPKRLLDITHHEVEDVVAGFSDNLRLHASDLTRLLQVSVGVLSSEPTVLDLTSRRRVMVVGDLHGSLPCLIKVLRLCGTPSAERAIVFNGDFVDRGQNSTEVLAAILLMKLAHPNDVYLLRGNHEDGFLATVYGFQKEIREKYPVFKDVIWDHMKQIFCALPFCARTSEAFIVHGGLPSQDLKISDIERISSEERNMQSVIKKRAPANKKDVAEILQGLVWSDPVDAESGILANPKRGSAGSTFGTDVTRNWLKEHGLRYLVRSHQMVYEGCSKMVCGGGTACYTVFSAANYPSEMGRNKGAVLRLEDGKRPEPLIFDHPGIEVAHAADHEQTLLNLIFKHKNRLKEAFLRTEPSGKISVSAWAEVMKSVLGVDIDFQALQPQLVQTVKRAHQINGGKPTLVDTGLIDSTRFVNRFTLMYKHGLASSSEISDETLEVLYSNHEQLRTVFEFLDTDGSGTLSLEEFQAGVKLLNERLPPEQHLTDADKLFSAVDIDRSGEIDADEFYAVFQAGLGDSFKLNKEDSEQVGNAC